MHCPIVQLVAAVSVDDVPEAGAPRPVAMPAGDGDGDDGDGDGDADGEDGNAAARDGHSGGDPGTEYSHTPIEATEGGEPPCPGRGEPDPNSTNPFVCNGEFCTHIPVTSEDRGDYTALRVQFGHTGCICKMPGAQWDAYNGELWQRAQKRRYRGQDGVPDPRRADQDELRYTLYYYASTGLYAVTGPCRMTMPRCLKAYIRWLYPNPLGVQYSDGVHLTD